MLTWKDRTAVISGGGGSVGFSIVCEFLQAGMNVVICSSSLEKGMETRKRLKPEWQERCETVACDVTDPGQAKACFSFAYEKFGSVDVLVNGAGFTDRNGYGDTTLESWHKCLGSSLEGTYVMTSEAIPYLEKSDSPRVLNISSMAGRMGGYEEGIATVAAKGGIIALTKASARDLAAKGITVNCIAAGIEEADTPRKKEIRNGSGN